MATAVAIVVLIAIFAVHFAYVSWLKEGIRPRVFSTSLDESSVRHLFSDRVARAGWKVVDDGQPMIVQSSLLSGVRQQIYLQTQRGEDGATQVKVGPSRWVTKWGAPKKGHTIRMRLDSFVSAVRSQDAKIEVQKAALKS